MTNFTIQVSCFSIAQSVDGAVSVFLGEVYLQIDFLYGSVGAEGAGVGLFPSVRHVVPLELVHVPALQLAHRAQVVPVGQGTGSHVQHAEGRHPRGRGRGALGGWCLGHQTLEQVGRLMRKWALLACPLTGRGVIAEGERQGGPTWFGRVCSNLCAEMKSISCSWGPHSGLD